MHELLGDESIKRLLVERWGGRVAPSGAIDRDVVAEIVFAGSDELEWLEGVLFPLVGGRADAWYKELVEVETTPEIAVVEVPLLFEAGIESKFNLTVCVVAESSKREERARKRGHVGLTGRSSRQLTQEEKARRSDYVLENNGSLEDLENRVKELAEELAGLTEGE